MIVPSQPRPQTTPADLSARDVPDCDTPAHVTPACDTSAKTARLRKHADYQRVYKASRKQFSSSMSWFLAARPGDLVAPAGPRVGLTVGKVIGKAHERNRIKRRMREVVRKHLAHLPDGCDLILHPKRAVMTIDFVKLDQEVLRIFRQASAQFGQMQAGQISLKGGPASVIHLSRPAPHAL